MTPKQSNSWYMLKRSAVESNQAVYPSHLTQQSGYVEVKSTDLFCDFMPRRFAIGVISSERHEGVELRMLFNYQLRKFESAFATASHNANISGSTGSAIGESTSRPASQRPRTGTMKKLPLAS